MKYLGNLEIILIYRKYLDEIVKKSYFIYIHTYSAFVHDSKCNS